jgi:hypothetical protein
MMPTPERRAVRRLRRWLAARHRIVLFGVALLVAFLVYQRQDHQLEAANRRSDRIEEVAQQVAQNLVQAKIDNCRSKIDDRRTVGALLNQITADAVRNPQVLLTIQARIATKLDPVPDDCVKILAAAPPG